MNLQYPLQFKNRVLTLPDLKTYFKAMVIKRACCRGRTEVQIIETEPRVQKKFHTDIDQLIFGKNAHVIKWEKVVFSINGAGITGSPCRKK